MPAQVKIIFLFIFLKASISEAQTLHDILPISSPGYDHVYTSVRDSDGNLYVAAVGQSSGSDQTMNIHDSTLYNPGSLLVKFNLAGKIAWVIGFDWINAMTLDKAGNLYVTGSYQQYSLMVAKLNPSGEIIWMLKEGATGPVWGEDIIVDDAGNSYITGNAFAWSLFGLPLASSSCCGEHDFFIKLDPTGKLVWIRASAADSYTHGRALAFKANGNIIVGGSFMYGMQLGSFSLSTGIGWNNIYLAELSSTGEVLSLKGFGGGTGHDVMSDLVIDASGSIYFSGGFTGNATFQDTTISAVGGYDFFIAKLDPAQNLSWVKSMGSIRQDKADYLLKTNDGILVSGILGGNATLGDSSLNNVDKPKAILARINSDGKVEWLKDFGYARGDDTWDISYRMGYTLNFISDNCFLIAGDFTYDLVTPERILSAQNVTLTDSFTGIISIGSLSTPILGPDVHLTWCDSSSVKIAISPTSGTNYWADVHGKFPIIDDSELTSITVSAIDYGSTVFELIKGCPGSQQLFFLNRLMPPGKPEVDNPNSFCTDNVSGSKIVVVGDSVSWYQDPNRKIKISDGNSFTPSVSTTVYVTDKKDGCESLAAPVTIIVNPKPPPPVPVVTSVTICSDIPKSLSVQGSNIKWYSSELSSSPSQTGNSITVNYPLKGEYQVYLTQTVNNCESDKSTMGIDVLSFDINDIFISNVVTANGDELNAQFYIKPFDSEMCLGEFKFIRIIDRWGAEVFYSTDRNFKWDPDHHSYGVYFYYISFGPLLLKGPISVLK